MEELQWVSASDYTEIWDGFIPLLYPAIKGISVVSVIWMLLQRLGQGAAGEGRGNAEIEGETLENPEGAGGFSLLQLVEVIVHLLPSLPPFDLS